MKKLSFVLIAFSFINFAHANVQPILNTNVFSFTNIALSGGWGNQIQGLVTIGANDGTVNVTIKKNGNVIDVFSFEAPDEYDYHAPTSWQGEYVFVIENNNVTTEFVANYN